MDIKEAKNISIVDFLDKNWVKPSKIRGNDFWYLSPYRDEKTPSFKVNIQKNLWYDFWAWEWGHIIDLAMRMFRCNIGEALEILKNSSFKKIEPKSIVYKEKQKIVNIWEIKSLALFNYLKERGISFSVARKYLKEISYSYEGNLYFALGFKNISGGYEVRNRLFKWTIWKKNISFFRWKRGDFVLVFEGFFDFLSSLCYFWKENFRSDVIVLNSVSLAKSILDRLLKYKRVYLFLDNDKAWGEARDFLFENLKDVVDNSYIYKGYKDFNEFLVWTR